MPGSKLFGAMAACVLAFGQTADDKSASVQGVVANSLTGAPLLRAHVVLRPISNRPQSAQKYGSLTTAEGKFSIAGIDPGQYSLAPDKVGFVTPSDAPTVTLQAGDKKDDLKLLLVPTGAIVGRVLDAGGEPMANARVWAEGGDGGSTSTDEKGQYRIGGLAPGRYRIGANAQDQAFPPEIRTDGTKEVHYAPAYYPSVLIARSATRVEVRGGSDTSGIEIRLIPTPIVRVSGTVSGLPPGTQNAYIEVRSGRSTSSQGIVRADGAFEIWKLDPGKHTIYAVWNTAGGKRMQSSPAEIEIAGSNIDRVALNAIPPMELAGHVEFEDEKAKPQMTPRPVPRRIGLTPLDGSGMEIAPVELDADDSLRLSGVSPNRYRVTIGWGSAYVKSMRLGPMQIDGAILDLRNGAAGDSLTLAVSSAMGTVSGTVSDDHGPVATALVALVPDDGDGARYASTMPGGAYEIPGIAPGKYRIGAVDRADRNLLQRSGNRDDYPDGLESIEIRPNDKLTRDLKLLKP